MHAPNWSALLQQNMMFGGCLVSVEMLQGRLASIFSYLYVIFFLCFLWLSVLLSVRCHLLALQAAPHQQQQAMMQASYVYVEHQHSAGPATHPRTRVDCSTSAQSHRWGSQSCIATACTVCSSSFGCTAANTRQWGRDYNHLPAQQRLQQEAPASVMFCLRQPRTACSDLHASYVSCTAAHPTAAAVHSYHYAG